MLTLSSRAEIEARIEGGWQVLDVGSGDRPFSRATMLVDRLPREHAGEGGVRGENPTKTIVRNGKPFRVADVEALPFADQSFDFVYASHVIEHVVDPARAIAELERVAPRGYIECPRAWFEFIDSSPFHRWLIDLVDGELWFRPKTETEVEFAQRRRLFDVDPRRFLEWYGRVLDSGDPGGRSVEKSVCHVCVYWEKRIPYRISSPSMVRMSGDRRSIP